MFSIEKRAINTLVKNKNVLFIIVVSILAIVARFYLLAYQSDDYIGCLNPWFEGIRQYGGFKGLKYYSTVIGGNYNYPYVTLFAILSYLPASIKNLYIIKGLSVFFDFCMAVVAFMIVKRISEKTELAVITYATVLLLPSVLLNSSMWAQCDSIYSTFILLSILFLIDKKYFLCFLAVGVSFSFKAQAMLVILPLLLIHYFTQQEFSILHFLVIPITNMVLCIPALLSGVGFADIVRVYFNQAGTYENMVYNYPNIYYLLSPNSDGLGIAHTGLYVLIAVLGVALFLFLDKKITLSYEKVLDLSVWLIVAVVFIMPGIHDRYCYVAEILSVIYFIIYKKRGYVAIWLNLVSLIVYGNYLLRTPPSPVLSTIALIYVLFFCIFTRDVFASLFKAENVG